MRDNFVPLESYILIVHLHKLQENFHILNIRYQKTISAFSYHMISKYNGNILIDSPFVGNVQPSMIVMFTHPITQSMG